VDNLCLRVRELGWGKENNSWVEEGMTVLMLCVLFSKKMVGSGIGGEGEGVLPIFFLDGILVDVCAARF